MSHLTGGVLVAADIFQTTNTLAINAQDALLTVAGAAVCLLLVRFLIKAPGWIAGLGTILFAAVLIWALSLVGGNSQLKKPFDDTVKTIINGAPAHGSDRAGESW